MSNRKLAKAVQAEIEPVWEPLAPDELRKTHAYWRACNYLAAGMIYLRDNPLLRKPLKPDHIKVRLLGHWGASPGLSFTYVHLNRLINKFDLNAIFLAGPGHGAPGVLAPVYLEGTYSEVYPNKSEDEQGMCEFFKDFSFPGDTAIRRCSWQARIRAHAFAASTSTRHRSPRPGATPPRLASGSALGSRRRLPRTIRGRTTG
jgi:phosphoketolase